jgi:hypothetical protein
VKLELGLLLGYKEKLQERPIATAYPLTQNLPKPTSSIAAVQLG